MTQPQVAGAPAAAASALGAGRYVAGPVHEEALARLHFLAERHQRLGLLFGPSGSGKTLLLELFAAEMARQGAAVAIVNLLGLGPAEMLCRLGAQLGLWLEPAWPMAQLWEALEDRLREYHYERRQVVLLFDDVPEASAQLQQQVVRLALARQSTGHAVRQAAAWTTPEMLSLVVAGRGEQLGRLDPRLRELADLHIELEAWQSEQTAQLAAAYARQAGAVPEIFAPEALARLHELAGGIPLQAARLAELSLLAAQAQQLEQIDATVVEAVHQELQPAGV